MTEDQGVHGACLEALRRLSGHVSPERVDRVWIFPPLMRRRSERGVIAAGCFADGERRLLVTVAYRAEETGKGITFQHQIQEEGVAPKDRFPKIMDGVVKRSDVGLGAPRAFVIEGSSEAFQAMADELAPPEPPTPAIRTPVSGKVGTSEAGTPQERSSP